ncbi:MAG: hypothetical protein NTY83_02250 [Candidatus Micrarchaeota archaeon]|nr:hypothetical protein [Candidatus Micrarchaeota archaeon]
MAMSKNLAYLGGISGVLLIIILIVTVPAIAQQNVSDVCTIDGMCQHEQQIPVKKEADAALAVSLMERDEAKILGKLVAEGGRITQSEVSRIEGIGKVKAHRILAKMEKRGIVASEKYGKTNMVKISDKYRKLFLKD